MPGEEVLPVDLFTDDDLTLVGNVLSEESSVHLHKGSYIAIARTLDGRDMRAKFEVIPSAKTLEVDLKSIEHPEASRGALVALLLVAIGVVAITIRKFFEPRIAYYSRSPDGRWSRVAKGRVGLTGTGSLSSAKTWMR